MRAAPFLLSHPFGRETPTWLDNPRPTFEPFERIAEGGVCNQSVVSTLTHNGTHVDASWHFDETGRTITDYEPGFWCFERPFVCDLPRGDGELIAAADLEPHAEALAGCDLALIRTGFELHRGDRARYGWRAPGFAADAAPFLRSFGSLRALGMDFPSATSPLSLPDGIRFHQVVLADAPAPAGGRGIVLVEDVHLEQDLDRLARVLIAPLLLAGADGAPATIFGWNA